LRRARGLFEFVVADHRETRQGSGDEFHGIVPLAPEVVPVAGGNQIARVNDKGGFRRLRIGRPDDARPPRLDVVLSVADIKELEALGLIAGGMKFEPLTPVLSVADT